MYNDHCIRIVRDVSCKSIYSAFELSCMLVIMSKLLSLRLYNYRAGGYRDMIADECVYVKIDAVIFSHA